ncbi:hypothetical protein D3C86_2101940 [compost metagenome]
MAADAVAHTAILGDGLGQQGHAHTRGNARQDPVERAQFHDLVRHQPDLVKPVFQGRAIEAARAEHKHGLLGHFIDERGQ